MNITIAEKNNFMPDTIIRISQFSVEIEENNKARTLNYGVKEINEIFRIFSEISRTWKARYVDKAIIDEGIFEIVFVKGNEKKEFYIKNKYPQNWGRFISFRNKLVREELRFL